MTETKHEVALTTGLLQPFVEFLIAARYPLRWLALDQWWECPYAEDASPANGLTQMKLRYHLTAHFPYTDNDKD